jgi:hypothetical protein
MPEGLGSQQRRTLLGGVAFVTDFKATGGKLSPEHERALRR